MKFIIKSNPMIVSYDSSVIDEIESKIKNSFPVTEEETEMLLDYICYETRKKLSNDILNDDFSGKDLEAASIITSYLHDLGVKHAVCNTRNSIDKNVYNNTFITATFETNLYGNDVELTYLIDPTFRQFFTTEKCNANNRVMRNQVFIKKPAPGYYIHTCDMDTIEYFLEHGYDFLDYDLAYAYCNSFNDTKIFTKKENEEVIDPDTAYDLLITGSKCQLISRKELDNKGLLINKEKSLVKKM